MLPKQTLHPLQSTEQHLDSRASWIVALGMSLNVNCKLCRYDN